jgi:Ax21 family sulfation-dependent quorum factor
MKKTLIALALAASLPLAAQAADKPLSYTYVEGNYVNLDNGVDGVGVRGSFDLGDSGLYGLGSYGWLGGDDELLDDDEVKTHELGLGYHHGISDRADVIGELAYRSAKSDAYRIDGARASVGLRGAMSDKFEGYAKANYYDASDFDGDVTATLGGQFKFNQQWGVTAETELGNGDQAYMVGVRASF